MKQSIMKRLVSGILISSMLLGVSACGNKEQVVIEPMEKEEVHSVSFDFLGGADVMPISGYYGPLTGPDSVDGESLPNYFTDEIFQKISGAGVNMIHHANTNYVLAPEQVFQMLELGEKHNVGICVFDGQICQPTPGVDKDLNVVDARISEYCDYPAFCGLYVVDEPGTSYYIPTENQSRDISTYATVFQTLRELGVFGAGNLLGVWKEADREKYRQYVEEYCEKCDPMFLSFDYYVWDRHNNSTKSGFLYNMDTIRHYAEKYELPFWCYIQAGSQWGDGGQVFDSGELIPTEGQLQWNVNVALAYGVKGIEYFPLIQPHYFSYAVSKDYDFQRNGILGAWGNKTQWWHYAKKMNTQIGAIDHVLMNSVNKGVIVTGEVATKETDGLEFIMQGDSWRELASVEGNTMIGCFNYQGKSALYVVNYEHEYAQKVTLNLHDSYNMSIIQNAEQSNVNTDTLTLDLKAGEGALIVFD